MRNFPSCHKGQGATEYLVLLAVVLIVALVSVALLGFFPGMASDAQLTQTQAYWQSTSPIALSEMVARYSTGYIATAFSMKIRNTEAYPIRITTIIGGSDCHSALSTSIYLGAGDETVIGSSKFGGAFKYTAPKVELDSPGTSDCDGGPSDTIYVAKTVCQNSNSAPGVLQINNFGFEYTKYVEGQQITKREIGSKPLLVKCSGTGS